MKCCIDAVWLLRCYRSPDWLLLWCLKFLSTHQALWFRSGWVCCRSSSVISRLLKQISVLLTVSSIQVLLGNEMSTENWSAVEIWKCSKCFLVNSLLCSDFFHRILFLPLNFPANCVNAAFCEQPVFCGGLWWQASSQLSRQQCFLWTWVIKYKGFVFFTLLLLLLQLKCKIKKNNFNWIVF